MSHEKIPALKSLTNSGQRAGSGGGGEAAAMRAGILADLHAELAQTRRDYDKTIRRHQELLAEVAQIERRRPRIAAHISMLQAQIMEIAP